MLNENLCQYKFSFDRNNLCMLGHKLLISSKKRLIPRSVCIFICDDYDT